AGAKASKAKVAASPVMNGLMGLKLLGGSLRADISLQPLYGSSLS
ncbi:MAG: hypothetical protein K0Q62_1580, partial [Phenylobacterium sp.]|nr:hypothetical protein [Phenylobacterium sp.]